MTDFNEPSMPVETPATTPSAWIRAENDSACWPPTPRPARFPITWPILLVIYILAPTLIPWLVFFLLVNR